MRYWLKYTVKAGGVEIVARVDGATGAGAVYSAGDFAEWRGGGAAGCGDRADCEGERDAGGEDGCAGGFEAVPKERTFNLVPGFECVPLMVGMRSSGGKGLDMILHRSKARCGIMRFAENTSQQHRLPGIRRSRLEIDWQRACDWE